MLWDAFPGVGQSCTVQSQGPGHLHIGHLFLPVSDGVDASACLAWRGSTGLSGLEGFVFLGLQVQEQGPQGCLGCEALSLFGVQGAMLAVLDPQGFCGTWDSGRVVRLCAW